MPVYSGENAPYMDLGNPYPDANGNYPGRRAVLLDDDSPIGSNTTLDAAYARVDPLLHSYWPVISLYHPQYGVDPNNLPRVRVRFAVRANWINRPLPLPPGQEEPEYDLMRWNQYLVTIDRNWTRDPFLPHERDYDPNDGTSNSVSHPWLYEGVPGHYRIFRGGHMMRNDGSPVIDTYVTPPRVYPGNTNRQHPHPIPAESRPLPPPYVPNEWWELEYEEDTSDIEYLKPPNERVGYVWGRVRRRLDLWREVQYRRRADGQWEPPFYEWIDTQLIQINFLAYFPSEGEQQPSPPYHWRSVHSIDHRHLMIAQKNWIRAVNVISLSGLWWRQYLPTDFQVRRVRHIPRYGTVLALANQGSNFTLRMCDMAANNETEVTSMTATSAMIEIAEDQRTALLVYSLSDGTVYRRISRDGGWTWASAQQCTLASGGNLIVTGLTDLDYSPRRRCWFLVAQTGSQTFKVYASDDGIVWTDTGL